MFLNYIYLLCERKEKDLEVPRSKSRGPNTSLSFPHVGPSHETQVIRLGNKCFLPMSHYAGSKETFYNAYVKGMLEISRVFLKFLYVIFIFQEEAEILVLIVCIPM